MATQLRSPLARFFRHSSVYAVGNLINRIGAFLLLPLYTNHLSVAEYGSLELLYVGMAIVSGVLSVGIAHATLRFYFEYDDPADRHALISTNLIASFVICLIGVVAVVPWSGWLSHQAFGSTAYTMSIYLVLATIVFELSSQVSLAYLRAIERSSLFVAIAFAKLIIQIAANTYLVLVMHAGVQGVILGNLLTVLVGWVVLTAFTVRHCGFTFHRSKAGPVLRYSFPFLLSTLVGLVSSNTDRVLISSVVSLQALGLYALSLKFSNLLQELIGEPFNRAYGAFRFSIMNFPDAGKIQAKIVRYFLIICVAAALGVVFFTEDVLRVISAREYWPAAALLPVMLLASVLNVLAYPLQTGILINKQPRQIFYINVLVALVGISANIMLIPLIGLNGAVTALLIAAITNVTLTNAIAQRSFPVEYEYGRWLILAAIALVHFALGAAAGQLSGWASILAKAGLMTSFIAVVLMSPVVSRAELAEIRSFMSRVLSTGGIAARS